MRCLPLLLFALFLTAAARAQPASDSALSCDIPAEFTTPSAPLPAVAAALAAERPVEILALGSGSTVGEMGGSTSRAFAGKTPGASFPYRTTDLLRASRPGAHFNLTVAGGRNMTADEMLTELRDHLAGRHYDLLLWQTGTVEAVHGLRPEALHDTLQQGIAAAAENHADVVLIDPLYSRFLRANIDVDPYEWVLQQTADQGGVGLFRRLALTQSWVNSGQIDLERVERNQRDKTVALLNTCLGQALADYVLAGAELH
jgi:hypothetical protein